MVKDFIGLNNTKIFWNQRDKEFGIRLMARLFALNEEIVVRIHDPEPIYSWAVSSKAEQLAFNQWGRVRFPGSSPLKFMPP